MDPWSVRNCPVTSEEIVFLFSFFSFPKFFNFTLQLLFYSFRSVISETISLFKSPTVSKLWHKSYRLLVLSFVLSPHFIFYSRISGWSLTQSEGINENGTSIDCFASLSNQYEPTSWDWIAEETQLHRS